jgi:hypothetical protein
VDLARQMKPSISICIAAPMNLYQTWMSLFGSVPLKLSYCVCQGSEAVSTVALPPVHDAPGRVTLVMSPTSVLATFENVDEWKLPSIVSGQETVVSPTLNLTPLQVPLIVLLLTLNRFAEAVPAAALRMTAAATPTSRGLMCVRTITPLG